MLPNGSHASNFLNPYTGTRHSEKLVPYNGGFAIRKSQKQVHTSNKKVASAQSQPSHENSHVTSSDHKPGSVEKILSHTQQHTTYGTNETSETHDEVGSFPMNYSKFNIQNQNQANKSYNQANHSHNSRFLDLQVDSKQTAKYKSKKPTGSFRPLINIALEDANGELQNPSGVFPSMHSIGGDVGNQDTPS